MLTIEGTEPSARQELAQQVGVAYQEELSQQEGLILQEAVTQRETVIQQEDLTRRKNVTHQGMYNDNLGESLLLHASFDGGLDADFAVGDGTLYSFATAAGREAGGRVGFPDESVQIGEEVRYIYQLDGGVSDLYQRESGAMNLAP